MWSFCLLSVMIRLSLQCAPHGVSRPWSTVCNHHVHNVEHFYFDNRTIYNKLVEMEKRIENIEKKENIPQQPDSSGKPDCQMCSGKPPVLTECEGCVPVTVSSPFDYYACLAVSVKCEKGASKLQLSEKYQLPVVHEDEITITCQKGNWVHISRNVEHRVGTISCLAK